MSNVTYERVNWEDSPSENTPVNGTNLNKMDKGIADCASEINNLNQTVSNLSHVGQIIMSTTLSTEASVIAIYGGSQWQQISGRFILGAGTLDSNHTYEVEATGGEAEHKLTISEMPSHSHQYIGYRWAEGPDLVTSGNNIKYGTHDSSSTGGNQSHNNMPPYFAAYIWVRIA